MILLVILVITVSAGLCRAGTLSAPAATPNLTEYPTAGGAPVGVRVGLYVTDLAMVNEASEDFEIQGYLYATWKDARLVDKSAARPDTARRLDPATVWNPNLDIANVRTFRSFRDEFFVLANGSAFWEEHFDAILSAEFYLRRFPFDTQALYVIVQPAISPSRADREPVDFDPRPYAIGIGADTYLAAWEIQGIQYRLAPTEIGGLAMPQARFRISVKRRSGFYIWQVFLPIVLMVMIPWAVFWVKADEFDWQMKIPLTVMLAMIAFDFAIARDLPRVSYLTFLDSILLVSFVFTFVAVVETIVVHALMIRGKKTRAKWIQENSRWIVPIAYLVVLLTLIPLFFAGAGRPQ